MSGFWIQGCSRCGGDHEGVVAMPLDNHFHSANDQVRGRYSHWAVCPTNGQPLLFTGEPQAGDVILQSCVKVPPEKYKSMELCFMDRYNVLDEADKLRFWKLQVEMFKRRGGGGAIIRTRRNERLDAQAKMLGGCEEYT